jgi:hypothetical protein
VNLLELQTELKLAGTKSMALDSAEKKEMMR